MDSVRVLLTNLIDYAGLFPPAALPMAVAAERYAQYRQGPYNWVLARFILPAASLDALGAAMESGAIDSGASPWRLSAVAGSDLEADTARVLAFNNRFLHAEHGWSAGVDSIEIRAGSADGIREACRTLPGNVQRYVEVPAAEGTLLEAVAEQGARAKIRTGGTSPDLFPQTEAVARFLLACAAERIPFKATAGLHHPIRGVHGVTDDPRSPRTLMHGFLNLFLAAALVDSGADFGTAADLLNETCSTAFAFENDRAGWRGRWIDVERLLLARQQFALSFGSCAFEEPIEELARLGLMPQ